MAWIAVVAALAGAAVSSEASKSAAKTLAGSANDASAAQLAIYNQQRQDQSPYRTVGISALERLAGGGGLATPTLTGVTKDTQAQLVDTSSGIPTYNPTLYANSDAYRKAWDSVLAEHNAQFPSATTGYVSDSSPQAIEAAIRMRLPDAAAATTADAGGQPTTGDPNAQGALGSLTRGFGMSDLQNDFASQLGLTRKFNAEDLKNDPVYQASYQAGLDMGAKRIAEQMNAAGMSNSGGAIKALARYAGDYTAQKAGDAFNRFQAEQGNAYSRYNDSFNRFNVTQGNQRNFLSSLAGIGQQATNQVGAAGTNFANNSSNIAMQAGQNAAGAQIAQGNIWGGTAQGIGNWWSGQQTLNRLSAERAADRQAYGRPSYAYGSTGGVDPNVYYSGNGQYYG